MVQNISSPLLYRELSRLSPDIFSHPVWFYFRKTDETFPDKIILEILEAVQSLISGGDLTSASQLLLACAALQKQRSNYTDAFNYAKQAWSLAEANSLTQVALWAAWGLCALSILSDQFETAAEFLKWLRERLNGPGDWILANILDLIQFAIMDQAQMDEELSRVNDWLLRWGEPPQLIDGSYLIPPRGSHTHGSPTVRRNPARLSRKLLRTIALTLKKFTSGQFELKWVEKTKYNQTVKIPPSDYVVTFATVRPTTLLPIEAEVQQPQDYHPEPSLSVYCFGIFHTLINNQPIEHWPNRKGLAVFKYLLLHRLSPVPKEVLMEIFWPNAEPESARNRLNVAIHGLRQALRSITDMPIILFEAEGYGINPSLEIWIDTEEFERHFSAAKTYASNSQETAAIREFEVAANLYTRDFLNEDLYEEWTVATRERLRIAYLDVLDRLSQIYFEQESYAACVNLCLEILERDNCREDAHCRMMRCYSRQGQPYLALRQFQLCVEALRSELDIDPEPTTIQLADRIRRREQV